MMKQQIKEYFINGVLIATSLFVLILTFQSLLLSLPQGELNYQSIRKTILISLILIMNSLFVFFFLTHKPPLAKMDKKEMVTFIYAYLGSYLPLFMAFKDFTFIPLVDIIIGLSAIWATVSVLNLGRSTDIIVTNRGIVTKGSYSYIRHPLYASYLLSNTLYLLISPFLLLRTLVFFVWVFCIYKRIRYEEEFLSKTGEYREYSTKVKYRIIPGIW